MKLIAVALAVLVGCVGTKDGGDEDLGGGGDSTIGDADTGLTDPGAGSDTSGSDGEGSASNLPEFHGRFGSPSIVRAGARLHAFFPIQGFQGHTVHVAHARSEDDGETWLRVGDALPQLGPGVKPGSSVWAPAAAKIGKMMTVNTWKFSGGEANVDNHGQIMHTFEVHVSANGKPVSTFVRRNE